ncbi:chemotaxis protein CheX [Clostridium chromiireducens]|uniref:Chemotaxis phosphatase CheX-like domain-containing protein n=1 Tax=Clostridium chromiireducens TaxID=225345 RepID=A0A1V4IVQ4_9CLOT|nr:chemotaxis protein CheX [Clostridium chromiireducens]MVX64473.1 hypothetical protein [Clostridium chromiireducens]OPJ63875.1 hypothetical protein CLCHR_13940 [Clostridium chromiireducens]RII35686.1 hypothetical protein D2A34_10980 [Clostridium chromiireducens]
MSHAKKNTKSCIIRTDVDINEFLLAVVRRTISVLDQVTKISVIQMDFEFLERDNTSLTGLTSIICIEDCRKLVVGFNYDNSLIKEIFRRYTKSMDIKEEETELYIKETASDLINITVGNVLSEFGKRDIAVKISIPLIIQETELLNNFSEINDRIVKIETEFGQMRVFCILSGNTFINKILDFK